MGTLDVWVLCRKCLRSKVVSMPNDGWKKWRKGEPIEEAMPMLDRADRELLISNICGECSGTKRQK